MKHRTRFRLLAALLLTAVLLSSCGQGEVQPQAEPLPGLSPPLQEESDEPMRAYFSMPYDPAAGFDPYRVQSLLNGALLPLLYDPLVKLDTGFVPRPYLAQEVSVQGLQCTVKLHPDIPFWDGTALSAQDVSASLSAARAPGSYWAPLLENIASAAVIDRDTLLITLLHPDREFASLLTFPIVKAGTHTAGVAVGSGRYIPEQTASEWVLHANEGHFKGALPIREIALVSLPDNDSLGYSLRTGEINYLYSDLSSPGMMGISGGSLPVNLNNLVYLGMNTRSTLLSQPAFRKAVEAGIDRAAIVTKAYSNRATAAYTPFNPAFAPAAFEGGEHSMLRANELLDSIGYSERGEQGERLYRSSPMRLRLLTVAGNSYREDAAQLIKEQLALVGITVEISCVPSAEFNNTLLYGSFDLYLAEIKLPENMNIAPLLTPGTLLGAGASDETLSQIHAQLLAGSIGYDAFLSAFGEVCPFVPLLYRQGAVVFSRGFYSNIIATGQDIFYNISEWKG